MARSPLSLDGGRGGAAALDDCGFDLFAVQPRVEAAGLHQLFVRAFLAQLATFDADDGFGVHDGLEAVRHRDDRLADHEVPEALLHEGLGLAVQGRGGLVEKQDRGGHQDRPGDGDALKLAAAQSLVRDARVQAHGEPAPVLEDEVVDARGSAGFLDDLDARVGLASVDQVGEEGGVEDPRPLAHNGHLPPHPHGVQRADVHSVEEYLPLDRIVEPLQKAEDRGLAGSGTARDTTAILRAHREADALQDLVGPRILEAHAPELDVSPDAGLRGHEAALEPDRGLDRDDLVGPRELLHRLADAHRLDRRFPDGVAHLDRQLVEALQVRDVRDLPCPDQPAGRGDRRGPGAHRDGELQGLEAQVHEVGPAVRVVLGLPEHVPVLEDPRLRSARPDRGDVLRLEGLDPARLDLHLLAPQHAVRPPSRRLYQELAHVLGQLDEEHRGHEASRALPDDRARGNQRCDRLQDADEEVHEGVGEVRQLEDLLEDLVDIPLVLLAQSVPIHVLAEHRRVHLRAQPVVQAQTAHEMQPVSHHGQK
mmetsp:Transcript_73549/g.192923  ORF Transcript_73549/g.192923 Transcript_73549/m.192923 type:complete len:536 (-) Transcript_73549:905-2512(-)